MEKGQPRVRWQVVLVAIAAALGAFWAFRPPASLDLLVGEGPAGPSVPIEPFSRIWREGRVVLLGLGDSVTRGYGASVGRGYFERLHAPVDALEPAMAGRSLRAVFPRIEATNLAVSFTISAGHLSQQIPSLPPHPADTFGVVVLTTGGNDLLHDYGRKPPRDGAAYGAALAQAQAWSASFRARLEALVAGIEERFPGGCAIFLATIFDPTDGVGDIERAPVRLPAWPDGLKVLELFNAVI